MTIIMTFNLKKYMKGIIIIVVITASIIGLIVWGNSKQQGGLSYFGETNVACLVQGHARITEHIHPQLSITTDGAPEEIPANIGISQDCMSELHTHDGSGAIHAESFLPGRLSNFHLGHFFEVWGLDPKRDGFDLEIVQDGQTKESMGEVNYIDRSVIELKYTSNTAPEDPQLEIPEEESPEEL
jgi:hypothetical protein